MTMSNLNSSFKWLCQEWLSLKTKALKTDAKEDWDMYEFFLKELKKEFIKNLC